MPFNWLMGFESISGLLSFCLISLWNWFIKLGPLSQPMERKNQSGTFSCAWHRVHVIISNSDWITELASSLVIENHSNIKPTLVVNCFVRWVRLISNRPWTSLRSFSQIVMHYLSQSVTFCIVLRPQGWVSFWVKFQSLGSLWCGI